MTTAGDTSAQEMDGTNPGETSWGEPVPASEAQPAEKLRSLWRNPDFMLLWSGQVISTLGSGISGIVFPLLILAITGSPAAAGIAGALGTIPYLVFSLPAGALVDRWDRKRVMIICDSGRALALGSIAVSIFLGVLTIWQIYIVALIEGTLFVFFNIAEVAALPRVVPKPQLPQATAQNQAAFGTAGLIGPPIGGFLFQTVGRAVPFLVDSISYIVSVVSLFLIRTPFRTEQAAPGATRNLRAEIVEGLKWLWADPLIRFMAFLTGGLNLANAATYLVVIVLAKGLGATDAEVGLVFSIGAIGGIVGSIIGGPIAKRFSFGQVIIATVWIEALLVPLYAVAPNVLLLGAINAVIFMTSPIYNVVQFSYRIALIPDRLQGRVNSVFRLLAFGFQPIGAALSGFVLERFGAVAAVGIFGGWMILMALLVTLNGHVRNAPPLEEATSQP